MGKRVVDDASLKAVADRIRDWTGLPEELEFPAGFVGGVDAAVSEGSIPAYNQGHMDGYDDGYSVGHLNGKTEGYDEGKADGITEGKQAEYDRFWDEALKINTSLSWPYRFAGRSWTNETFAPPRDIVPAGSVSYMFAGSGVTDVKGVCERLGISIDFSKVTGVYGLLADSEVQHFVAIDLRSVSALSSGPLFNATNLISVDKIILKDDGSQTISNFANNCRSLVDIEFEGVIGASINFQWSTELSKASIESIMAALSPTTSGLSVTFSATAVSNAFTDTEWATLANTRPNWTINLV
ncbi:MAG: hypothetical protein IJA11_08730 [Oscillospiraceae bacterium]|nr:hypothetical protein [Oscillospiraceae bacterium]